MKATFYAVLMTAVTFLASGCSDSNLMGPQAYDDSQSEALQSEANQADCGPGEHQLDDAVLADQAKSDKDVQRDYAEEIEDAIEIGEGEQDGMELINDDGFAPPVKAQSAQ